MAAPIKIVKSSDDEDEDCPLLDNKQDICTLCVEKAARYTCPRCNIRYCSLPCYRGDKHEGCSEAFYRDCVLEELKDTTASSEDKQKVLEMLAREREFQEEGLDDAEDDGTPSLADRMEGLDLDKNAGEVWKRLTPEEKEEFAAMLKDGRLAKLVSVWTPWWMVKKASSLVEETSKDSCPACETDIPDINLLLKGKPSSDVKHNVVNVISAFAFISRLHNGDHHDHALESSEELLRVCGVLGKGENYPGPKEAVHAVIDQVAKEGSGFVVPTSFPMVLLGDVTRILQGKRLSPLAFALSALSEVLHLLSSAAKELKKGGRKRKMKRKAKDGGAAETGGEREGEEPLLERQLFLGKRKVMFLLSWAQRYGMALAQLCLQLDLELEGIKSEAAETKSLQNTVEVALSAGKLQPKSDAPKVQMID